jgi:hypothetical protein
MSDYTASVASALLRVSNTLCSSTRDSLSSCLVQLQGVLSSPQCDKPSVGAQVRLIYSDILDFIDEVDRLNAYVNTRREGLGRNLPRPESH